MTSRRQGSVLPVSAFQQWTVDNNVDGCARGCIARFGRQPHEGPRDEERQRRAAIDVNDGWRMSNRIGCKAVAVGESDRPAVELSRDRGIQVCPCVTGGDDHVGYDWVLRRDIPHDIEIDRGESQRVLAARYTRGATPAVAAGQLDAPHISEVVVIARTGHGGAKSTGESNIFR